jgi:hypothetical protein
LKAPNDFDDCHTPEHSGDQTNGKAAVENAALAFQSSHDEFVEPVQERITELAGVQDSEELGFQ